MSLGIIRAWSTALLFHILACTRDTTFSLFTMCDHKSHGGSYPSITSPQRTTWQTSWVNIGDIMMCTPDCLDLFFTITEIHPVCSKMMNSPYESASSLPGKNDYNYPIRGDSYDLPCNIRQRRFVWNLADLSDPVGLTDETATTYSCPTYPHF